MDALEREQTAFLPGAQLDELGRAHLDTVSSIAADGTALLERFKTSTDLTLVDVRDLFPDDDSGHRVAAQRKRVAVMHHDAVSYDGQTIEDDLDRIGVIHRYHLGKGWGGTGYHFAIPPATECVYILGGLEESRAHVSGAAAAANPSLWGADLPNAVAIGIVWLGNFADRRDDEHGTVVGSLLDRPTESALRRYQELVEWLPTVLDRDIVAVPHKGAHPGHTSCPGDWIARSVSDTFRPAEARSNVEQALAILGTIEVRLIATRGDLRLILGEMTNVFASVATQMNEVADGYESHEADLRQIEERIATASRLLGSED